jgi:serine/threonine-protein phosphatase 5
VDDGERSRDKRARDLANIPVPLAVLMSAGSSPSNLESEGSAPAILSEQGKKRYFICHGGPPVSKDGVTLEEVAKIDR